jgi:DNA invertase Pin-like site-specific DNA recombinase
MYEGPSLHHGKPMGEGERVEGVPLAEVPPPPRRKNEKLSTEIVLAIRKDSTIGLTAQAIATKYGVHRETVYKIRMQDEL